MTAGKSDPNKVQLARFMIIPCYAQIIFRQFHTRSATVARSTLHAQVPGTRIYNTKRKQQRRQIALFTTAAKTTPFDTPLLAIPRGLGIMEDVYMVYGMSRMGWVGVGHALELLSSDQVEWNRIEICSKLDTAVWLLYPYRDRRLAILSIRLNIRTHLLSDSSLQRRCW